MTYKEQLDLYKRTVEDALKKYVTSKDNRQSRIYEAMQYSLLAGGKRIRPILFLASAQMAGVDLNEALPFACSLEMIHTYSLIHDDLPAMDNDDLRRAKPTNHIVFGDAVAILAGDALLNKAFETALSACKNQNHIEVLRLIATSSGTEGMIGGQVIDMECEGKNADEVTITQLNRLKTGALFFASVVGGVMMGSCTSKQLEGAKKYADNLGLAFQIQDDLLDNSKNACTGKTKGSDIKSGKSTFLSLFGQRKCKEYIESYINEAVMGLDPFENSGFLKDLILSIKNREN